MVNKYVFKQRFDDKGKPLSPLVFGRAAKTEWNNYWQALKSWQIAQYKF